MYGDVQTSFNPLKAVTANPLLLLVLVAGLFTVSDLLAATVWLSADNFSRAVGTAQNPNMDRPGDHGGGGSEPE